MYFVADTSGVLLFSKRQVIAKRSINSGINRGVPTAIGRLFGVGINKDGASINQIAILARAEGARGRCLVRAPKARATVFDLGHLIASLL